MHHNMPRVAILISHYNQADQVLRLLEQLETFHGFYFEVLLLNNVCSTDQRIKHQLFELDLKGDSYNATHRLSYAAAYNLLARKASKRDVDYLWILDSISQVSSDLLHAMLDKISSKKNYVAVGVASFSKIEKDIVKTYTSFTAISREVLLINSSSFSKLGGFNEMLYWGLEVLEFQLQAKKIGSNLAFLSQKQAKQLVVKKASITPKLYYYFYSRNAVALLKDVRFSARILFTIFLARPTFRYVKTLYQGYKDGFVLDFSRQP